jgi:hypothetical protein
MNERICFLVGAGLSRDVPLPMSVQLAAELQKYVATLAADGPNSDGAAFQAAFNFLVGGIRFQEGVLNRDPNAHINIEQIATAAIRLANRNNSPLAPYVSGWHQRLVQLEAAMPELLPNFVKLMFTKLTEWLTPGQGADLAYLCHFNDFVPLAKQIDIFSLNYDLCVETALHDLAQVSFCNGFSSEGWRPEIFEEATGIRLFKLHGSLDWIDDEEFGIVSIDFPRHLEADSLAGKGSPLLIFGTDQKATGLDPFVTLLYHLSSALDDTNILVIIGYSFGDEYINQVVLQRFRTNPRLKIIVVSPTATKTVNDIGWLNNPARVFTLDQGAKDAFNRMLLIRLVRQKLAEAESEAPFGAPAVTTAPASSTNGERTTRGERVMRPKNRRRRRKG